MRLPGALLAGLLVVSGCVAGGPSTPSPAASTADPPTSSPSASSPAATVGTSTSPAASTSGTDLGLPDYAGAQPMPASVAGPMLWPTSTLVQVSGYAWEDFFLHGFVDVRGKLVVPARYEGYDYCRDRNGKVDFVVATAAGRKADVLDLTGKVIARTPSKDASCGPPGLVVFTREIDTEIGNILDGLMDVETGRILLPHAAGRKLQVLNADTVDVTEPNGNYFLNPRTGKRTPHPGWLTSEASLEAGAPGVPASTVEPNSGQDGLIGYLDLTGKWVLSPRFHDASSFEGGHALVARDGAQTFLDTTFQQVSGPWEDVGWVSKRVGNQWKTAGFLVSNGPRQALLAPDLRVVSAEGASTIDCLYDANAACLATGPGRQSSIVVLPEGTMTPLPDGFSRVLSRSFVADSALLKDEEQQGATRVLALATGRTATLDGPSRCSDIDDTWLACEPDSKVLPRVVLDVQGRRTAFATIDAVDDPTSSGGAAYYWVVAGRYQGFIDASGGWRYRESRYTRVEE